MTYFDDEQSWHEAQNEYMERYAPPATMSDAHAEWHRNSGNPMGTPGCPQDACHLPDEPEGWSEYDEAAEEAKFGAAYSPVEMGYYDDDPNPYHGDMGYDDGIPF